MFRTPQVTLFSNDVRAAVAFYQRLGFRVSFRWPEREEPKKLELDGCTLGIAAVDAVREAHGLDLALARPSSELPLWTDDVDAAFGRLLGEGITVLSEPHDYPDRLRVAWVADPDDTPVQLA